MYSPTKLQYTRNVNLNNVLLNLITEVSLYPRSTATGRRKLHVQCCRAAARHAGVSLKYNITMNIQTILIEV